MSSSTNRSETQKQINTYQKAIDLATKYHKGQRYGDEPYTYHLSGVYQLVLKNYHSYFPNNALGFGNWNTPEIIVCVGAAAYLHDILEDTKCTREILRENGIPELTIDIVTQLTHNPKDSYFDYIMKMCECGPITVGVKAVKLADLDFNISQSENMINVEDTNSLNRLRKLEMYRFAREVLRPRNYL
jgi:(p)ppGpp synthase/HD superfamily hydrolase